ncbi:MAG: MFS transporter [Candidatus Lokiarchaeota archaeon]
MELKFKAFVTLTLFVYILPFAFFQLFAGTFSDIFDKKKVVIIGYVIFIFGLFFSLSSIYLRTYPLFLLAFFFQGLGFSFINPTILAILSILTPRKREGLIMGLYNSSAGIGVTVGSIISGLLSLVNWRLLFITNPIVAIISGILFLISLTNCQQLICGPSEIKIGDETKKSKVLQLFSQLKKNLTKEIILLGLIGFFCFFTIISLISTINEQISLSIPYLNEEEITSSVSIILTINGLISVIISPFSGNLLNKIKPKTMMIIGFSLMLIILWLPFGFSLLHFIIISFIIYLGSTFIWPALFKSSMQINKEAKGTNSAIINSLRFFGYASVPLLYNFFGIPILYYFVFVFSIGAIGILVYLKVK